MHNYSLITRYLEIINHTIDTINYEKIHRDESKAANLIIQRETVVSHFPNLARQLSIDFR